MLDQPVRLFADFENPFGFTNTSQVFLETGGTRNETFRSRLLSQRMRDDRLDGDTQIDDFDIASESPENALNVFALREAERRFGNGDGIFTVEEQEATFGAWYELFFGPQWFEHSNRSLRLGLEVWF